MSCLTTRQLDLLVTGGLEPHAREEAKSHLSGCERCRTERDRVREHLELADSLSGIVASGAQPPDFRGPPGYRLGRLIQRGGQAVVYEAVQEGTGRSVAVKALSSFREGDERAELRFEREIELIGNLRHPDIVSLLDAITVDGRRFLVMELIDGRHLTSLWDDGPQPPSTTLPLFVRICRAIHHAHQRGIIHRDLKPENILIDEGGAPHVLDFGIARLREETGRLTRTGEFAGTLLYAAPEQVTGRPDEIDVRSDVFALGIILFELLTGSHPFDGAATLADVVRNLTESDAPMPSRRRPSLDRELDCIAAKAMSRDPAARYQSAEALARDVERLLAGEPLEARSAAGSWYVVRKLAGRHRLAVGAGIAAVALLALTTATALHYWREATHTISELRTLTDESEARDLIVKADAMYPVGPAMVPAAQEWLEDVDAILSRRAAHRRALEQHRMRARPHEGEELARDHPAAVRSLRRAYEEMERLDAVPDPDARTLKRLGEVEVLIDSLEQGTKGSRKVWRYDGPEDARLERRLARLVARLDTLALYRDRIAHRLERARTHRARCFEGRSKKRWEEARAAIEESPRYGGLEIEPQLGLVPLHEDARSGLWEFWHIESGDEPLWDAERGGWRVGADTGIVLVLLPGGRAHMGARQPDVLEPRYGPHVHPHATVIESPVHEVELDPFFISKYETTAGQWERVSRPAPPLPGLDSARGEELGRQLRSAPRDQVTWREAMAHAVRFGLTVPTEAQWEYACRGGRTSAWFWGDDLRETDRYAYIATSPRKERRDGDLQSPALPVDALDPNPFGLHHVIGNLVEWTQDLGLSYSCITAPGDGLRIVGAMLLERRRVLRGGSLVSRPEAATCSWRTTNREDTAVDFAGVRFARLLERTRLD